MEKVERVGIGQTKGNRSDEIAQKGLIKERCREIMRWKKEVVLMYSIINLPEKQTGKCRIE